MNNTESTVGRFSRNINNRTDSSVVLVAHCRLNLAMVVEKPRDILL